MSAYLYFLRNPLNDRYHLSNPELRVRSLQMFGRILVNLVHQSGPHTVGIKGVREVVIKAVKERGGRGQ